MSREVANKVFTEAALEQAKRLARQRKTFPMPEGMTLEQVAEEVGRESMAWLLVFGALNDLANNPRVNAVPSALDFVRIVAELARNGNMTDSAEEALLPVDGLLPKGKFAEPFLGNAGRGDGPVKVLVRKVLPKLEKKLRRKATALEVWGACAAARNTHITFENAPTWGTPVKAVPQSGDPVQWARFRVIVSEVRRDTDT